jgi:hypothetical protein
MGGRSPVLPDSPCPKCGATLSARPWSGSPASATSFDECLRRCEPCGVGLSNARTIGTETYIFRDVTANVPAALREGFAAALGSSVNQLNKKNKLQKAAFSTSEDALTWTYFNHLRLTNRLRALRLLRSEAEPTLVLWGSVVGAPSANSSVPNALADISRYLGESIDRRTEPDVILDHGSDGIAVIEVKYRSANELKEPSYQGWRRYLQGAGDPFTDVAGALESKCYELVRNWRMAWELGERLQAPIVVANLGPSSIFETPASINLKRFEGSVRQDERHQFRRLTWREALELAPPDATMSKYFKEKYGL